MKVNTKVLFSFFLLTSLCGCFGANNETANVGVAGDDPTKPFTDVYIEYPGPNEKWAGPQTFIVHLSTHSGNSIGVQSNVKDSEKAKVSISNSIFKEHPDSKAQLPALSHGLTVQSAREQIKRLNTAIQEQKPAATGCLLPVRVRLIRVDGAIVSRQGCRGQSGWPKIASEITNLLIESSMADEKMPTTPSTTTATSVKATATTAATAITATTAPPKASPSPSVSVHTEKHEESHPDSPHAESKKSDSKNANGGSHADSKHSDHK